MLMTFLRTAWLREYSVCKIRRKPIIKKIFWRFNSCLITLLKYDCKRYTIFDAASIDNQCLALGWLILTSLAISARFKRLFVRVAVLIIKRKNSPSSTCPKSWTSLNVNLNISPLKNLLVMIFVCYKLGHSFFMNFPPDFLNRNFIQNIFLLWKL